MIRFADDHTKKEVRNMWKVCFDDSEEFIELYFSMMYQNENTLLYFEDDKAVASLQMIPYQFTFCGTEIPVSYISGACTYPEYRKKGYMSQLLMNAFKIMQNRSIPLSILIPAEKWLYGYYAKYGYEKVFQRDESQTVPLKEILNKANNNIHQAYKDFDRIYRQKDFCIQKTEKDFIAIVRDAEADDFPDKINLSGMARIIDLSYLLGLFAQKYSGESFTIRVTDNVFDKNNGSFSIHNGSVQKLDRHQKTLLKTDINFLTRLLFGFQLGAFSTEISSVFPSNYPVLNLMLE